MPYNTAGTIIRVNVRTTSALVALGPAVMLEILVKEIEERQVKKVNTDARPTRAPYIKYLDRLVISRFLASKYKGAPNTVQ